MKKVILLFFTAASLLFSGCNDLSEDSSSASLTLDKESITISNALGGATTATVTATLTGSSSSLEWFSADKSIVTVTGSGNSAVILCQGKAGTANVGVRTADNSLEAICSVSVSLSSAPASCVTDLALTEDSETASGFTLTWTDPVRASAVVIDVFESEEDRTAGLAKIAAREVPDVYSTYTVDLGKCEYTVSDLLTDQDGKNYYVAVSGYLNNYRSLTAATIDVQLKPDVTPPSSVTEVTSDVKDHSITLTWTDPVDADYSYVDVSINSDAVDYSGTALDSSVMVKTINKALQTVTFDNLKADQEYTFTFKTADVNGNQQDEGISETVSTAADTTATAAVTDAGATFTVNGNVTVIWNDPEDFDFKEIVVTPVCNTDGYVAPAAQTVAKGVKSASFTCDTEAEYKFNIVAYDYDGNASTVVSSDAEKPVVTDVTATKTTSWSGITISWTNPTLATGYTYEFKVSAYDGDTEVAYETVSSDTTSHTFSTELDFDVTYTYKITTVIEETSNSENNATYVSSSTASSAMSKYVVNTIKNSSTGAYIIPNTSGAVYVLSSSAANESYSAAWILRPALDGTTTYTYTGGNDSSTGTVSSFSLEATDAEGNPTGKYLYITNLSTSNTSATDGTAVVLEPASISDATHASFFQAYASYASTGYKSIRPTCGTGGFMLGNDSAGNVLKYRYSLNVAGVNSWHWYMDISEE